ncbi:hypothetical protein [Paraburkholderia caffeinilytica]|uniref:hypothetical protein n=1 Tax=Paraburkholderia caffeinilytica TaxID=1761016 RepID=UPI003DA06262
MEDIVFSIIATDSQFLLDDKARAAVPGNRARSVKEANNCRRTQSRAGGNGAEAQPRHP